VHNRLWSTMPFHVDFFKISALLFRSRVLVITQHFAPVIVGPPEIMRNPVDLQVDRPGATQLSARTLRLDALAPDLGCERVKTCSTSIVRSPWLISTPRSCSRSTKHFGDNGKRM
jgi:hypothetical protein